MDVQRVERIADFVRDAGREQRQRLDALAFDGLKCFLTRLGRVVQNQRHAGTARGFAVQRRGIEPEKARTRIMHFKFVAHDALAARVVGFGNHLPVQFRQNVRDVQILGVRRQADEPRDGLVEINNAPGFVHHQHAILNGIEQCFEKAALAREPLDDRLQAFRVQPPDAAKHLVEKTGFGCSHWLKSILGVAKWHNPRIRQAKEMCSGDTVKNKILLLARRQRQENFFKLAGAAALFAQFLAGADGDQLPAVDDADAVGHFLGDAQLMRGDQHGHARERAFLEHVLDDARVLRVEADHRLVNHEHLRVVQQRGDDGDALARAVRKAFQREIHKFGEMEPRNQFRSRSFQSSRRAFGKAGR